MKDNTYRKKQRLEKFFKSPKTLRTLQRIVEKQNGVSMSEEDIRSIVETFLQQDSTT